MFVADCPEWCDQILPNLPVIHRTEYILRLGEFAPNTPAQRINIAYFRDITNHWCFPFIEVDSKFDHESYEDHVEAVESDMIKKYGLTEDNFI